MPNFTLGSHSQTKTGSTGDRAFAESGDARDGTKPSVSGGEDQAFSIAREQKVLLARLRAEASRTIAHLTLSNEISTAISYPL